MSETTTDLLDVLVSEGYGIFTQVTSILNSLTQTSTSPTATTASASSSSESTSDTAAALTSGTSSLPSATAAASSSLSSNDSSAAAASSTAAAASSTPSAVGGQSNGGGGGHNKLAIILGCVLDAEEVAPTRSATVPFYQEMMSSTAGEGMTISTTNDTAQAKRWWKKSLLSDTIMLPSAPPHDNPFVPVPPPPRKSAPNSRAGLTDGSVPGDDPYLMEQGTRRPVSLGGSRSRSNSGHGKALALGAGGAALAAAALHHHHKKNDSSDDDMAKHTISRKPVPVKSVNGGEAWPYGPPPPLQDNAGMGVGTSPRQSFDSSPSRPSRDAARANATFDQEYKTPPDTDQEHHHSGAAKTVAALGAGALGGAALAHHRNSKKQQLRDSDSSNVSQNATLVALDRQDSDLSNTSSDSHRYSDAMTRQQPGMHELPSNIPPTPPTRERRDSAFGAAAPAAAVGSYFLPAHRPRTSSRSRSRSHSSSRPVSFPEHPDDYGRHRTHSQPPVPSRSPARHSFSPSSTSEYGEIPVSYQPAGHRPTSPLYESKAIVGDNGYPHMNVPRRKSGGEYDYSHNGGGVGPPAAAPRPVRPEGLSSDESRRTSDDSTWRLSMGMPGGWQRAGAGARSRSRDGNGNATQRGSLDGWASPVSPVGGQWEAGRGLNTGGRLRRSQLAQEAGFAGGHGQEGRAGGGYEDGGYVSGVGAGAVMAARGEVQFKRSIDNDFVTHWASRVLCSAQDMVLTLMGCRRWGGDIAARKHTSMQIYPN